MRYSIIFLLVIVSQISFAQKETSEGSNLQSLTNGTMFRVVDERFKGVEGYPTLFEEYVPGKIYMRSGQVVSVAQLNFDVMTDEVLVKRDNREMVVNRMLVKKFTMLKGGDSLRFVKISVQPTAKFSEELVNGRFILYKLTTKILKKPQNTGEPFSNGKTYSELVAQVKYFWQKESGPLVEIKNKKTLLSDLQEASKIDYSDYVKKSKVDVKEEVGLKLLFIHVNSTNQ
jgi:hypothetical protein